MVREGRQESGEEAEEDRTAGRAGESHHNSECQHQVYHHTAVSAIKTPHPSVTCRILDFTSKNIGLW